MNARRVVFLVSVIATAVSCFTLGVMHTRRGDAAVRASYDAQLDAIRAEVRTASKATAEPMQPAATMGRVDTRRQASNEAAAALTREKMVAEIKQELQLEMGLLPVHLLRDRRSSFVELYSYDNFGKTNYGTAGYLGHGYFITVKHAVVALGDDEDKQAGRKIVSVRVVYHGKEIPARVIDTGDASVEVHRGD